MPAPTPDYLALLSALEASFPAADVQSKDEAECYNWATTNVGTDPFQLQKQAEQKQHAKQAGKRAGAGGAVAGAAAGAPPR